MKADPMSYKAPATRKAIKTKVKSALMNWLDENLDDSGDTGTVWDEADDCAARTYQDEIEDDNTHSRAMKESKKRFFEELISCLHANIENVFEDVALTD